MPESTTVPIVTLSGAPDCDTTNAALDVVVTLSSVRGSKCSICGAASWRDRRVLLDLIQRLQLIALRIMSVFSEGSPPKRLALPLWQGHGRTQVMSIYPC